MQAARHLSVASFWCFCLLAPFPTAAFGQRAPASREVPAPVIASDLPQPMNWTASQDHQNMMDQLGIKALRPGPSITVLKKNILV